MFNVTNVKGGDTTVNFNSVAGTLMKSCPESRVVRFHTNSPMAKTYFDEVNPHRTIGYTKKSIMVLQVMLCANEFVLVEFIDLSQDGTSND